MILGGGRRHFVPKVTQDPEEPDKEGRRLDGRNLIEEWSRNHRLRNVAAKYVANKEQFESVDPRKVNHLLGNEWKYVSTFSTFPTEGEEKAIYQIEKSFYSQYWKVIVFVTTKRFVLKKYNSIKVSFFQYLILLISYRSATESCVRWKFLPSNYELKYEKKKKNNRDCSGIIKTIVHCIFR